ncbi:2'-5' RNA ligase family protein [Mycolicibacterium sp. CBMA 226]|uniref:2'-5' RNA ligase family protein n=1 Tax=Mycolicibacterium sp. CBMA 226 TaxID=2606611 RepID=UPI0012DEF7AD|nr:2'-5' RNA ligase family protein [Mycolicibacterium sp. CBMA 226]MUL74726.1 2'-5' RNA ligase family protein [Mycolicibacterium sp. CBMA 226]
MVHSVELLFDLDTEAVIRRAWDALRDAGIAAQPPAARPHTTLVVADEIDDAVLPELAALAGRFPFQARIGAALVFGRTAAILTRLVVPSAELLDLHADVCRRSAPHLRPGPMPHTEPGDWTPHVTLARRVPPDRLARALGMAARPAEISGTATGLRLWNGNERTEIEVGSS